MRYQEMIYEWLDDFPILVCVAEEESSRILYGNKLALRIMGEKIVGENIRRLLDESMLVPAFFDSREKRVDCSVAIGGRWYRMSRIRAPQEGVGYVSIIAGIDITAVKETKEQLTVRVYTDSMTGIYNRQTCINFLTKHVDAWKIKNECFTVCYLDLNDLKMVNDSFGHAEGDAYIMAVVSVIRDSIRQADIFARMGGDEFLIIFPDCAKMRVAQIMENVQDKLKDLSKPEGSGAEYSISYGILEINSSHEADVEYILNEADSRMYQMKNEYRRKKRKADAL